MVVGLEHNKNPFSVQHVHNKKLHNHIPQEGKEEELGCFQQFGLASSLDIQIVIFIISVLYSQGVRQAHLLGGLG